jgi:hypothetical protein
MRAHKSWPKLRRQSAHLFLTKTLPTFILEEPRRIRMGIWLESIMDPVRFSRIEKQETPSCGTVGCIGGWTEALTGARRGKATQVLGLKHPQQSDELFMPVRLVDAETQGTPAHARAVVRHLHRFATKYKMQLRRTMITPRPSRAA